MLHRFSDYVGRHHIGLLALFVTVCLPSAQSGGTSKRRDPRAPRPTTDETPGDLDGDGYSAAVDSDDSDPNINPGATEVPDNAVDDDSDGVVDETPGDLDGDGYSAAVDSDDSDPNINPGATEVPDNAVDDDSDDSASNIMKKASETADGITQNMK
jgi:hypothetical protein